MYYWAFTVWASRGQAEVTGIKELASLSHEALNFVYQVSVEDLR